MVCFVARVEMRCAGDRFFSQVLHRQPDGCLYCTVYILKQEYVSVICMENKGTNIGVGDRDLLDGRELFTYPNHCAERGDCPSGEIICFVGKQGCQ